MIVSLRLKLHPVFHTYLVLGANYLIGDQRSYLLICVSLNSLNDPGANAIVNVIWSLYSAYHVYQFVEFGRVQV